jgi:aminoglycoside/choline kinase family phosphotransferase
VAIHEFIREFLNRRGLSVNNITSHLMAGDGSKRLFSRITHSDTGESYVLVENSPVTDFLKKENFAYLMIGRHLFGKGLPLPEIYDYDLDNGWFILEDMGDVKLQDEILIRKDPGRLLEEIIELLFRLQTHGIEGFKKEWCCQTENYDHFVMRRYESDYFRDSFLTGYLGMKSEWPELEAPFNHISEMATMADSGYFLHRDFQSRNIMIRKDKIGILDWQGSRTGPLGYDLASFLIDPYINIAYQEKKRLYGHYLSLLKGYDASLRLSFERYFPYLAVQRNLQILGAFSYLTKVLGKKYFKGYIPSAVATLKQMLDELNDPKLSSLTDVVNNVAKDYLGGQK